MKAETTGAFDPLKLVRPNIARLKPYSSARDEFSGLARIHLDANENSLGSAGGTPYNRYPDPLQNELKKRIAEIEGVEKERIFIGNGSDEAIDLLFRVFCEPGADNAVICPPTYGMYEVSAAINDVEVRKASLTETFGLDSETVFASADGRTKLVFICSPNNPTGNAMDRREVLRVADGLGSVIVIDEAYFHFSAEPSFINELGEYPNLVVLRTFSKAWGLAGLRIGTAFASEQIIGLLNKVKPPYNVSEASQREMLEALGDRESMESMVRGILRLREELRAGLSKIECVKAIYPTDANFLLVKTTDARGIYRRLVNDGIVVRDRSRVELCGGCLRITVGTAEENAELLRALRDY